VASGSKMVEDLPKGTEEKMSFAGALRILFLSILSPGMTSSSDLGKPVHHCPHALVNPRQSEVMRGPLTRNLSKYSQVIRDEFAASYSDVIPQKNGAFGCLMSFLHPADLFQNGWRSLPSKLSLR
jgi:hypothetical protein